MQLRASAEAEGDPFLGAGRWRRSRAAITAASLTKLINKFSLRSLCRGPQAFLIGAKKGLDPEVMLVAINA
jgi:hypothetical protein